MQREKVLDLTRDLTALLEDLSNERRINAQKLAKAPPSGYSYGEGMHDGLRYAAEALESTLRRHGLLA